MTRMIHPENPHCATMRSSQTEGADQACPTDQILSSPESRLLVTDLSTFLKLCEWRLPRVPLSGTLARDLTGRISKPLLIPQTVFRQIFNPHPDPQHPVSCATSAYFGSPRGLVSCCKTYSCCPDKGEVGGSSPPRPTIQITNEYAAILTFPLFWDLPQDLTCSSCINGVHL
jgi:hypothetical protein